MKQSELFTSRGSGAVSLMVSSNRRAGLQCGQNMTSGASCRVSGHHSVSSQAEERPSETQSHNPFHLLPHLMTTRTWESPTRLHLLQAHHTFQHHSRGDHTYAPLVSHFKPSHSHSHPHLQFQPLWSTEVQSLLWTNWTPVHGGPRHQPPENSLGCPDVQPTLGVSVLPVPPLQFPSVSSKPRLQLSFLHHPSSWSQSLDSVPCIWGHIIKPDCSSNVPLGTSLVMSHRNSTQIGFSVMILYWFTLLKSPEVGITSGKTWSTHKWWY